MLLATALGRLVRVGSLSIIDANGQRHDCRGEDNGLSVTIRLHDRALHRKLLLNPYLYVGEAYTDGTLTIEEGTLGDFLRIVAINETATSGMKLIALKGWYNRQVRWLQQHNPAHRARRNVAHHYDLSDQLYELFLDKDRQYSCAYFNRESDTLEQAQENKKRHIAGKLLLKPGQKVLDIGSGWGGLALHIARAAEVEVTGLTLSEEQLKVSRARAEEAGLADRVQFHLRDYRAETGQYDRIVSVGMFEHVGARHFRDYFAKINELLTEDGVCLLHSIGRMEPPGNTNAWLRKYIFPGGYTPAMSEVLAAVERESLYVTDVEVLRLHYAQTLHHWYDRFQENRDRIAELYDERFCRMWEFYLKGCEIAFHHWNQMVFQMQLTRRQDAVPLRRDYMTDYDRAARGRKRDDIAA